MKWKATPKLWIPFLAIRHNLLNHLMQAKHVLGIYYLRRSIFHASSSFICSCTLHNLHCMTSKSTEMDWSRKQHLPHIFYNEAININFFIWKKLHDKTSQSRSSYSKEIAKLEHICSSLHSHGIYSWEKE
jgi:hypothetical protein